jgi:hypothetical protein
MRRFTPESGQVLLVVLIALVVLTATLGFVVEIAYA